jgi:ribonuclease D
LICPTRFGSIEDEELPALARTCDRSRLIGLDTEFLRERTFFPQTVPAAAGGGARHLVRRHLALRQPRAAGARAHRRRRAQGDPFRAPGPRGVLSLVQARDLAGIRHPDRRRLHRLKPQVGYAELVKTLLDVTVPKGQTRTDWSKRPLTREQLEYAADDVLYLGELNARLKELGREQWAAEDCAALEDPLLYEPDPATAWERVKGIQQLDPKPRARAKSIAVWREKLARERDLPRAWIISDAALFAVAHANPTSRAALGSVHDVPPNFNEGFANGLLKTLQETASCR